MSHLKNRIKEFEDEIKKNSEQQLKLHVETKTTIDGLIEKTNQITSDTTNLTKALKDSKTQGDYGEMKLRMLLENSGLEENVHYGLQENFTVTDEDGVKNKRPGTVIYILYLKRDTLSLILNSHLGNMTTIVQQILVREKSLEKNILETLKEE